ncbi:MAG: AbrB/MazE/SpoVT family DNA-binding domain-containing protein [Candidatus Nanohalobium sp.]
MAVFTDVSEVRFSGKIDSKGRITVPARIRKKLGLKAGDELEVSVNNCEVKRKQVSGFEEAKAFVQDFSEVKSFSFDGEKVEVVVRE